MKHPYFYWLYNPTNKLTKIGITDNFERRFQQIENACGCDLITIAYCQFEHAQKLESLFLAIFKPYKTKGEWFKFKHEDAFHFIYNTLTGMFLKIGNNNEWFFEYHTMINPETFISVCNDWRDK